jgi:hypothetical protein
MVTWWCQAPVLIGFLQRLIRDAKRKPNFRTFALPRR